MQEGIDSKTAFIIGPAGVKNENSDEERPSHSSIDELNEDGELLAHHRFRDIISFNEDVDQFDILSRRSS